MRAKVGDELTVKGRHPGDQDRRGEIIDVIGADGAPPYVVIWRDGAESTLFIRPGHSSDTRPQDAVHEPARVVLTRHE